MNAVLRLDVFFRLLPAACYLRHPPDRRFGQFDEQIARFRIGNDIESLFRPIDISIRFFDRVFDRT